MAQVIQNKKEDLHMNNFVASHGSSWNGIQQLPSFSLNFLMRFLTRHLREQTLISQFPFLRSECQQNCVQSLRKDHT